MNKKLYIIPAVLLLMVTASCSREEALLWPESAAQRIDAAVAFQKETLASAPYGWSMYYFAPESDNGGVNFTLDFNSNGSVVIGTKNIYNSPSYAEETSMWEIITDNGPVLSFNSYNTLFHYFSDPDNSIVGTGTQGVGLGGDYEFMVMNCTKDSVVLKGKKTGVYCKMFPLEADATGEAYFQKLDDFETSMFNSLFPYIWFEAENGERYTATFNTGSRTVDFCIEGGDPLFDTHTTTYVVTNKGIRFLEPFEGDNEAFSVQEFVYNPESTLLTCVDDAKSYFSAGDLNKFFIAAGQEWSIDSQNSGGTLATNCDDILNRCKALSFTLNSLSINYNSEIKNMALGFSIKSGRRTYPGSFYGDFKVENNELVISFDKDKCDSNAKTFSVSVPEFYNMIEALSAASPFTVESDSKLCPSTVKLVSKANSDNYLLLNR